MATIEAAARSTIDAQIAVAHLQHVRGSTTAGTVSTAVPRPAIVGNKTSTTCAEGVVFPFAKSYCGWVMNIWGSA